MVVSRKKVIKNCEPGREFVFRLPSGIEVGRAKNIIEFESLIKNAPLASLLFHARGGHFPGWLVYIGEEKAADRIAKSKFEDATVRVTLLRCLKGA